MTFLFYLFSLVASQPSLLDSYDYAMHGRVFAIKHNTQQYRNVEVLASFGGLLFKLDGEQSQLQALEADSRCVILAPPHPQHSETPLIPLSECIFS
jgi:hypothetical protein